MVQSFNGHQDEKQLSLEEKHKVDSEFFRQKIAFWIESIQLKCIELIPTLNTILINFVDIFSK